MQLRDDTQLMVVPAVCWNTCRSVATQAARLRLGPKLAQPISEVPVTVRSMKILACAVAAAITLTLTACGSSGSKSDPVKSQTVSSTTNLSTAVTKPTAPNPSSGVCVGGADGKPMPCSPTSTQAEKTTGNPLGDANRAKSVSMGELTQSAADSIAWAGDVRTKDGSFVQYPNGLRITFVSAARTVAPISEKQSDSGLDSSKRLIRVTLHVSNTSSTAIPVTAGLVPFILYEGANISQVDSYTGYAGDTLTSPNNQSVVGPHSSFDVFDTYQVSPGAELAVETETGYFGQNLTPFVFYGFKVK